MADVLFPEKAEMPKVYVIRYRPYHVNHYIWHWFQIMCIRASLHVMSNDRSVTIVTCHIQN